MGSTLSQSRRAPSKRNVVRDFTPRRLATNNRGLAAILAIGAACLLASCDRIEHSRAQATHDDAGDVHSAEHDSATPFAWPDDPSHPVLRLDIDSDPARGTIAIELMPELAPVAVAHVIDLARHQYYDGTTFHRVIPGFMIQGGDPNSRDRDPSNDGQGNPDLRIADEFSRAPFVRGVVGMGNKGTRNTTGGQFFIMHADNLNLDGRYTVIGRVRSGMEVVDAIMEVSIDRVGRWGPKDRPIENVVMRSVAIEVQNTNEVQQAMTREGSRNPNEAKPLRNSLADL